LGLMVATVLCTTGLKVNAADGTYGAGSLLALQGVKAAAVYYIGSDGNKYVFPDEKTYFTWYANFDDVVKVNVAELDKYPNGGAVTYRPGTKLVTTSDTARIYAVEPGGVLRWLPTEAVAKALYGDKWYQRVQNVIPGYFSSSYTNGSELTADKYPSGTLLQVGSDQYYVDGTNVRKFASADAFEANNFVAANAITVSSVSGYTTGTAITGEEITLSGYKPGTSTPGVPGTLTVSLASDTPTTGVIVGGAARVPFTKVNFVNTGNVDVTVDQVVVERTGLAQDGNFSSLDLLDAGTMLPLNTGSKTLGSLHTASFNDNFVVPAGATKGVYIAANMAASLATYAGETPILTVKTVTLTNGTVSGSLPIAGNYQNINGTLTVGAVTVAAGGNNPSATTKEVGTTKYTVSSLRLTATNVENMTVSRLYFTNNQSSESSDVANVELVNANTGAVLATKTSIDSDHIDFNNLNLLVEKGKAVTLDLRLDVVNGSSRVISYDIDRQADISVKGNTYGYTILPTYPNAAEPYFNSADTTIGTGSLRIESVAIAPSNVTSNLKGVTLGKFKFVAKGEPVNVTSIGWNFFVATSNANFAFATDLTNITVYNAAGAVVAGPIDITVAGHEEGAAGINELTATTTDTITVPVGENIYTVKADITDHWNAADTIQAGVRASLAVAKGDTTGKTITLEPASNVQSTSLTVRTSALTVTVGANPAAQTIVGGAQDLTVATYILNGSTSGGTVKVTAIKPKVLTTGASYPALLSGWTLWDGTTQIPVSSESTTCSGTTCSTAATSATTTLTLAENALSIAAGVTKTITVKADVGTGATSGTFSVGIMYVAAGDGVVAVDTDAQTVDMSTAITDADGQAMTLSTGGELLVAIGTDPVSALVTAATTVDVGKVTLQAKRDNMTINYLGFTVAAPDGGIVGSSNDLNTLYLYDGSTKLGEVAVNGTYATITPTGMTLTNNESKLYTIKALFANLDPSSPASSGQGIKVNLTNVDVSGTAAGSSAVTVTGTGTAFNTYTMFKTLPTVTQIDFTGGDAITGDTVVTLKKFSVAAGSQGPVGLYRFSFGISTNTVALTESGYYLYESDSSSSLGTLLGKGSDITVTNDTDASRRVLLAAYFDVNDDNSTAPALEHKVLTAGTTKYYTLRGTVSGHDGTVDNESISTLFLGDPVFQGTATANAGVVAATAQHDFIWSDLNFDLYSTTTATNNGGWFNGFRVPGLDSTSSTPQTITD